MAEAKEPLPTLRLSSMSDRLQRRPLDPAEVALRRLGHEPEEPPICILRIPDLDALRGLIHRRPLNAVARNGRFRFRSNAKSGARGPSPAFQPAEIVAP
jgi:hypothetical protein